MERQTLHNKFITSTRVPRESPRHMEKIRFFRSVFDNVLPDGSWRARTKDLSHNGACLVTENRARIRTDYYDPYSGNYFRDLTNWNYACAGHFLALFLKRGSQLHSWLAVLNDEKIGDIFEAALGYCWLWEVSNMAMPEQVPDLRATVESFLWAMEDLQAFLRGTDFQMDNMTSWQFAELRMLRPWVFACN